jgi:hypothetical protein
MRTFYLVVLLALFAFPAYAGWDDDYDGTGTDCETVRPNPAMQRRCWYNSTGAGTGYSPMLEIDQCENYSVRFYPDIDGTETNGTIQFLVCGDPAIANVPNACFALEGKTLSSSMPAVYGADGTWGIVDIIVACGATANCRVEFACNQ